MHELIALGLYLGSFLEEEADKADTEGSADPERDGLIACMKAVFPKRKGRRPPFTIVDHEREQKIGIGSLKILSINPNYKPIYDGPGLVRITNQLIHGENEGQLELSPGIVKAVRAQLFSEESEEYDFYAILDLIKSQQIQDTDFFDKREKCEAFGAHLKLTHEFINPLNSGAFLHPNEIISIHLEYADKARSLGII
jgi:hypothetical protein